MWDKNIRKQYYSSLRKRIIFTILLLSLTPTIIISMIILYQFKNAYKERMYNHLSELVQKHAHIVDNFLREKLFDIHMIAESYSYEQLSHSNFLRDILDLLRRYNESVFVDLGVINANGNQISYAGPFNLEGVSYTNDSWFNDSMNASYFISDVFLGKRGTPHFIIVVKKYYNKKPWLLRATIDFGTFTKLVQNIQIGKTGFAFIINKKGELQTQVRFDISLNDELYKKLLLPTKPKRDNTIIIENKDKNGPPKIYVATYLKSGQWILIFQQALNEAFLEFSKTAKISVFFILIGVIIIPIGGIIMSNKVISRIAKADEEKEQMNEQMIRAGKMAAIGQLAAGIAHEINNPVAIMIEEAGWIIDLLEEEDLKKSSNLDEIYRALNQIQKQGLRCKDITHKLLSFARHTDPTVNEIDICNLIKELTDISAQHAKYSQIQLIVKCDPNLPKLMASATEMQQVLLNLINNAFDAMEKTGGKLELSAFIDNGFLKIEVSDTGCGIPESNIEKIFEPFFTTKPVGKGTGLGLSICYGIIKKIGGDIKVSSKLGHGTKFTILIPGDKLIWE